ncbi:MAG: hypothetical protein IPH82_30240 [Chloroflexi bacterium]|nr:hypothetical protein [Chloroflexota bacterium]
MQSFSTTVSEGYGAAALAAEDSQARQITANDAISESYKQTALNVFSSKLAETIQEDGLGAANAMIAYQQALGLITPEEAAKLEEVALKTEAITDATGALFDAYMSDGVLTRGEMDLMAEAVRSIDEGTALMSDTIIKTAAEDIPKLVGLHQETATFDEKLGNASVSAGTLKDSLDALPTRLDIDVYINTHGSVPDTGGATGGGSGGAPSGSPGGNGPGPGGSYASGTGGWVTVPPGYPNDTYNARLTSGEQFAVIPAGGGKAGMGANISISFAGAIFQGTSQQQAGQIAEMVADRIGRLS